MAKRSVAFPEFYQSRIEETLGAFDLSLKDAKRLAECVVRLSDFYTQNPDAQSPWHEPWVQIASLVYYFPLNYLRVRAVLREGRRVGFLKDIEEVFDFGSGTASGLHAWRDEVSNTGQILRAGDVSRDALDLGRKLLPVENGYKTLVMTSENQDLGWQSKDHSLLLASYVLTELAQIPSSWRESEALAIIEPATHQDSRRLLQLRQELIDEGYSIWAPCTHQRPCPLLTNSARDWCHDRIHFAAPEWFLEIEKYLPMKNRTLTFSYLLARKTSAPSRDGYARLVGDRLDEKGKTRQSLCRGPEREFLAWFPGRIKQDFPIEIERGDLIQFNTELGKTSNEARVSQTTDISILLPDEPLKT